MNHQRALSGLLRSGPAALALACATVTSQPPSGSNSGMGGANGGANSNGGNTSLAGAASVGGTTASAGGGTNSSGGKSAAATASTGGISSTATGGMRATGGVPCVSVPTTALPYTHDFEDSNLCAWMVWNSSTSTTGIWAVGTDGANHILQQTASGSNATWEVGGNANWADRKFSVKVRWVDTSKYIYVSARFNNTEGYAYLQAASGKPKIRVRNSGSTTDVCAGTTSLTFVAGTWYTITVTATGSTFSADIDGTPVCSGTSTAVATGGIAVGTDGSAAAFDDVNVTAP